MSNINSLDLHPNPSTGPRTPEGRAISSRNATKHGCCADTTQIMEHHGETIEDYKAVEATWFAAYSPKTDAEKHLVQDLVNAEWFLLRANRVLAEIEDMCYANDPYPFNWDDRNHRALQRFQRYQTFRANAVIKCRKAIEDYRKNRAAEVMKAEKHQIYKEKSKPEPTFEEFIEQVRAQKLERDRNALSDPIKR
jgi:hypothetical protein